MSMVLDANSILSVQLRVVNGANPIGTTTAQSISVRDLLIAAFSTIPSQAAATTTVAQLVTALKTIPASN